MEIDFESLPEVNQKSKVTVITQPGMRYAQANAIVENLLLDTKFQELSIQERQRILERLLNEIRGRMMEDIILLETKIAKPDKKIFKLQFTVGECDMTEINKKLCNSLLPVPMLIMSYVAGDENCNYESIIITSMRVVGK